MRKNQDGQDKIRAHVIPFPNLHERLYQKGMDCMETQNFEEAIDLFKQALQMGKEDPRLYGALLASLYEVENYVEAKELANELLNKGIGSYYEILDVYLMILIQLNEHEEVVKTLIPLFEENEVPSEKAEHLFTLLQLSKKAIKNKKELGKPAPIDFQLEESNLQKQLIQVGELADKNIHPFLESLKELLENDQTHPLLQTVILNILRDNQVNEKVQVSKLGKTGEYIPANLLSVGEMPFTAQVEEELENFIEDHDPILLTQLKDMNHRHTFLTYPFDSLVKNPTIAAAAYRAIGYQMYGDEINIKLISAEFGVEEEELQSTISFLLQLEQISSPII